MTPEQHDKYEREEAEYRAWTAYYGSQYYGGWDRDPLDGRYKPKAVIEAQRKPAEAVQAIEKAEDVYGGY